MNRYVGLTALVFGMIGPAAAQTPTQIDPYSVRTGTTAGTLAAGNDVRITGALQATNNLSDVASVATARINLGLGTASAVTFGSIAASVTATGSTTARALADRAADVVNVRDFGAAGNGADATAAFQAAAAAIPASGATLEIPQGQYTISGTTTLPSHTHVRCDGAVITAAPAASWTGGVNVTFTNVSGTSIEIEGCRFSYPYGNANYGGGAAHVMNFIGTTNVYVHDNVSDGGGDFVADIGTTNTWETNNFVTNVSNACYDHWNGFTDAHTNFNYCTTLSSAGSGVGAIQFTGISTGGGAANSVGFEAIGNTIYVNNGNGPQCFEINGFAGSGADDRGMIVGNKCYVTGGNASWGVLVTGTSSNGEIADNVFYGNGGAYGAVSIASSAAGWDVHNNTAVNWQAGATGVFSNAGTGGALSGNHAYASSSPLLGAVAASVVSYANDTGTGTLNLANVAITSGSAAFNGAFSSIYSPTFGWNGSGGIIATINAIAGSARQFAVQTAGVSRWNWGVNGTAETGSNVGSDWIVQRSSDAGTVIDQPITVTRSTGVVTLADGVALPPGQKLCFDTTNACVYYSTSAHKLYFTDGTGAVVLSIADGGNAIFKGSVTQNGTP